ncbi:unnamed protein product [Urochloa humidicola]
MQNYAGCINLTDSARSVQLFKIDAFAASAQKTERFIAWTTTSVAGFDWMIYYYPSLWHSGDSWISFRIDLSRSDASGGVVASAACRLVDPAGKLAPSVVPPPVSATLSKGQGMDLFVMSRKNLASSGYLRDDSFLVECVVTVLLDKSKEKAVAANSAAPATSAAAPSLDLHRHFGELWRSQKGTDITFVVSGKHITAHKCVLAARSPVFMAELFGGMKETASQSVVIEDMEPEVFRALMQFIYTDTSLELEEGQEDTKMMAQHLLVAADRYGMERLKIICEEKVCASISIDTAATLLLALAEQHGCSKLKARCMEFMVATPANLQAVIATEGYKHLTARCPSVLSDLLVARYR